MITDNDQHMMMMMMGSTVHDVENGGHEDNDMAAIIFIMRITMMATRGV